MPPKPPNNPRAASGKTKKADIIKLSSPDELIKAVSNFKITFRLKDTALQCRSKGYFLGANIILTDSKPSQDGCEAIKQLVRAVDALEGILNDVKQRPGLQYVSSSPKSAASDPKEAEIKKLKKEASAREGTIMELEANVNRLRNQMDTRTSNSRPDTIEDKAGLMDKLQHDLEASQSQKKQVEQTLRQLQSELTNTQVELKEKSQECEENEQNLERLEKKQQKGAESEKQLDDQQNKHKKDLAEKQAQIKRILDELETLRSKASETPAPSTARQSGKQDRKSDDSLEQKLKAELDHVQAKCDTATKEREAATKEREAATKDRDAATKDRDTATKERDAAATARDKANEKLQNIEKSFDNKEKTKKDLIRALTEKLGKAMSKDDVVKQLRDTNAENIERLASEMSSKVAQSEGVFENISIGCRPMKIGEDYLTFSSNTWLDAKTALDNTDMQEKDACALLTDILMAAETEAQAVFAYLCSQLSALLNNPVTLKRASAQGHGKAVLPVDIMTHVGDYLRSNVDRTNMDELIQLFQSVKAKPKIKSSPSSAELTEYISSAAALSWKMTLQRPAMTFDIPGAGQPWRDDQGTDLAYGSEPKANGAVVRYYLNPVLRHGGKVMAKGKVMVK